MESGKRAIGVYVNRGMQANSQEVISASVRGDGSSITATEINERMWEVNELMREYNAAKQEALYAETCPVSGYEAPKTKPALSGFDSLAGFDHRPGAWR